MHILIAEDEMDLNGILVQKMKEEGFTVDSCFDGGDALYYLKNAEYDAAIIDVMMPELNGFEVVEKYRLGGGSAPILFLTARDSIDDKVKGLDLGANDYLTKPFSFEELMARIRALTRSFASSTGNAYTMADLTVNCNTREITRGGKKIALSAREFSMLEYLLRNKGRVLSREQIENNLYSFDYEGSSNVVDVYIRYLRKKIDDGFDKKLIHTVRGYGYVLR